jgi:RHS repeat-associated protein
LPKSDKALIELPSVTRNDLTLLRSYVKNYSGTLTAAVELDAWGGETDRSWQQTPQSQRYTTYLRDGNESDEAMHRRYNRWWGRFNQPDPSDTSYDVTDPQSLNRYSYVQNDPVNFVDPSGLNEEAGGGGWSCSGTWRGERTPDGTIINFQITSIHCISWGGSDGQGNGGQEKTVPDTAEGKGTPQKPIYCQPDVIEAMNRAWSRTGNGTRGNEAGFVLNGTPSNYRIVDTKSGNTQNEQKMVVYSDTFLLFHVHPNRGSTRNPSTPDNNARGDRNFGDTIVSDRFQQRGRTIPFLVGHQTGLTMYDPKTKQVTVLRENLDWTKPCK